MSERPFGDDDRSSDARDEALSDDERRYLLQYLRQCEAARIGELTGVLAGRVATDEKRMVGTEEGEALTERLTEEHLPALEAAGMVRREGETVRLAADEGQLRDLLPHPGDPGGDDTD